jgi:hypothetical protein
LPDLTEVSVIKTSAVDMALAQIVKMREHDRLNSESFNLYEELLALHHARGGSGDELPDKAYSELARMIAAILLDMGNSANTKFAALLTFIRDLPDDTAASAETVDKLKDTALEAADSYLFTLSMCKASLADADYKYLAEVAIDANKDALQAS